MISIYEQLGINGVFLEEAEFVSIHAFIDCDGFRKYVSEHLKKYDIRTYPKGFYPLLLALGQTFYHFYYINKMTKTVLKSEQGRLEDFRMNHSQAHHLLPGLDEEINNLGPELIEKMAHLTPGGNYEIEFMFDVICKLTKDLDKITE